MCYFYNLQCCIPYNFNSLLHLWDHVSLSLYIARLCAMLVTKSIYIGANTNGEGVSRATTHPTTASSAFQLVKSTPPRNIVLAMTF